jgi:hypothetical protein
VPPTTPVAEPTWADDPDLPLQEQLEGKGQLKDLRTNPSPNLKGQDIDVLLKKTPRELEQMVADGQLTENALKAPNKTWPICSVAHTIPMEDLRPKTLAEWRMFP